MACYRMRRSHADHASRGKQGGRTLEIQRLIGRALRTVTDLSVGRKIPSISITTSFKPMAAPELQQLLAAASGG